MKKSLPTPNAGDVVSRAGFFTRPRNRHPKVAPVGKVATTPAAQSQMDVPGKNLKKGAPKEGSRINTRPQSV